MRALLPLSIAVSLVLFACGDDDAPSTPSASDAGDDTSAPDTNTPVDDAGDDAASGDDSTDTPDATEERPTPIDAIRSRAPDACPALGAGASTWPAGDLNRTVDVYLPAGGAEGAAITFLWHGAGDNPSNVARAFGAATIADTWDSIVVVPHARGTLPFEWGIFRADDKSSDVAIFDHVTACLVDEHGADPSRVHTTGFSAGALWSTWLVIHRSDVLASAVLLSGGVSRMLVNWAAPERLLPVLIVHGGDEDVVATARFGEMSEELAANLAAGGHLVVLCDHGGGHSVPFSPATFALPFLYGVQWGDVGPTSLPPTSPWPVWCQMAR
jgi:predicted esterase